MLGDQSWLGTLRGELCEAITQPRSGFTAFAGISALLAVAGDQVVLATRRIGGQELVRGSRAAPRPRDIACAQPTNIPGAAPICGTPRAGQTASRITVPS